MNSLTTLQSRVEKLVSLEGWNKSWGPGGCYLHLEASEFIEALRPRSKEDPIAEGGDVLFTLLSLLSYYEIDVEDCIEAINLKIDERMQKFES